MNEHPSPLTDEQLDELLSADLDGEFDAAAEDLGLSVDVARALLADRRDTRERIAALASARDALSIAPEIDELMAARLRAKAVAAGVRDADERTAQRHRTRRILYAFGAVAAALIGVVAVSSAVRSGSSSNTNASSAPQRTENATPTAGSGSSSVVAAPSASAAVYDYGDFANVEALASAVHASERSKVATTNGDSAFSAPHDQYAPSPSSLDYRADGTKRTAEAASACDAQLAALGGGAPTVEAGTARVAGRPVTVHVFDRGADRLVIVVSADCKLLNRQVVAKG